MKRDPLEIIEKIFDALEKTRACSINELSKQTGLHNVTVKRYVKIIQVVREEPRVDVIKTRHSIIIRTIKKEGD